MEEKNNSRENLEKGKNNKTLIIVLVVLGIILLATIIFRIISKSLNNKNIYNKNNEIVDTNKDNNKNDSKDDNNDNEEVKNEENKELYILNNNGVKECSYKKEDTIGKEILGTYKCDGNCSCYWALISEHSFIGKDSIYLIDTLSYKKDEQEKIENKTIKFNYVTGEKEEKNYGFYYAYNLPNGDFVIAVTEKTGKKSIFDEKIAFINSNGDFITDYHKYKGLLRSSDNFYLKVNPENYMHSYKNSFAVLKDEDNNGKTGILNFATGKVFLNFVYDGVYLTDNYILVYLLENNNIKFKLLDYNKNEITTYTKLQSVENYKDLINGNFDELKLIENNNEITIYISRGGYEIEKYKFNINKETKELILLD